MSALSVFSKLVKSVLSGFFLPGSKSKMDAKDFPQQQQTNSQEQGFQRRIDDENIFDNLEPISKEDLRSKSSNESIYDYVDNSRNSEVSQPEIPAYGVIDKNKAQKEVSQPEIPAYGVIDKNKPQVSPKSKPSDRPAPPPKPKPEVSTKPKPKPKPAPRSNSGQKSKNNNTIESVYKKAYEQELGKGNLANDEEAKSKLSRGGCGPEGKKAVRHLEIATNALKSRDTLSGPEEALSSTKGLKSVGEFIDKYNFLSTFKEIKAGNEDLIYANRDGKDVTVKEEIGNMEKVSFKYRKQGQAFEKPILDGDYLETNELFRSEIEKCDGVLLKGNTQIEQFANEVDQEVEARGSSSFKLTGKDSEVLNKIKDKIGQARNSNDVSSNVPGPEQFKGPEMER